MPLYRRKGSQRRTDHTGYNRTDAHTGRRAFSGRPLPLLDAADGATGSECLKSMAAVAAAADWGTEPVQVRSNNVSRCRPHPLESLLWLPPPFRKRPETSSSLLCLVLCLHLPRLATLLPSCAASVHNMRDVNYIARFFLPTPVSEREVQGALLVDMGLFRGSHVCACHDLLLLTLPSRGRILSPPFPLHPSVGSTARSPCRSAKQQGLSEL